MLGYFTNNKFIDVDQIAYIIWHGDLKGSFALAGRDDLGCLTVEGEEAKALVAFHVSAMKTGRTLLKFGNEYINPSLIALVTFGDHEVVLYWKGGGTLRLRTDKVDWIRKDLETFTFNSANHDRIIKDLPPDWWK